MFKKITIITLAGFLTISPLVQKASAERLSSQISNQEQVVKTKKEQLSDAKANVKELENTVKQLNTEIEKATAKLEETKKNIEETKADIEEKKANIALLQEKLEKREDLLKQRLVAMQEEPKVSTVTKVILGSESITDMISRLSAINTLFEADNNIMDQQKREQELLDKEKDALQKKEASLTTLQQTLTEDKKALTAKKEEKQVALDEAQEQMQVLIYEVNEESSALNELNRQALFLQQQIEEEENPQVTTPSTDTNNTTTKPETSKPETSKPVAGNGDVVSYAMQFIGVPYVFGGSSPSGFDCSGFIWYVYKNNGVNIGRASVGTYWSIAKKVSEPVPGDMVFFQNTYKPGPSHIGIYIGNGKMVHAGSKGIAVSSLSTSYNKKHFLGYGRF